MKRALLRRAAPATELVCELPGSISLSRNGFKPDFCLPLDEPVWQSASDADLILDDDSILGFRVFDQWWAIPWFVMKNHHVANLTLDGHPLLVTLCEACVGGGVYDPIVSGKLLHFRMAGGYGGTTVMSDDQTGSVWGMVDARPIHGAALDGGRLSMVSPIMHTTWDSWRREHPDTWVEAGIGAPRGGHGSQHPSPDQTLGMPSVCRDTRTADMDARLEPNDLAVGMELETDHGEVRHAFALDRLHDHDDVLNATVAGQPVAVVSQRGTWIGTSFSRIVAGRVIKLRLRETSDGKELVNEDAAMVWDLWGQPKSEATVPLTRVPGRLERWWGWTADGEETGLT